jgi:lysophospholipase L1-like esterase
MKRLALMLVLGMGCVLVVGLVNAQNDARARKWDEAVAAFEAQDVASPPPQGTVLFVGSSSIRFWDLPKSFPGRDYINRGFGGSELEDAIRYADRIILKHRPRAVVVYAGDNDVAAGKDAAQVFDDYMTLVATIHGELPDTPIYFIAIKPSLKRWDMWPTMDAANELIRAYGKDKSLLYFVDIAGPMLGNDGQPKPGLFLQDGLHLNAAGYAMWTSILNQYLAQGETIQIAAVRDTL